MFVFIYTAQYIVSIRTVKKEGKRKKSLMAVSASVWMKKELRETLDIKCKAM